MQTRIGEVIESTSTSFTAGAYELLEAPPFGALVRAQARAEDMAVYGLVYDIRTGSKEPGGRALVRGRTYSGRVLFCGQTVTKPECAANLTGLGGVLLIYRNALVAAQAGAVLDVLPTLPDAKSG